MLTIAVSAAVTIIVQPVFGIDFVGGSLLEIVSPVAPNELRILLDNELSLPASVQKSGENSLLIKMAALNEEQHQSIIALLQERDLFVEELRFESIGPTIGAELRRKAVTAVAVVVVVLVIYLAYTFRQTANLISAWKFGVAAIYALIHDLMFVIAMFAILGVFGVTIDTLFVTAMLAILGYSVNDTIVIFNRLKSEWLTQRTGSLLTTLDAAVNNSLIRSLNTSLTTLLVLSMLLMFGGATIRWFIVALATGTVIGTYSSLLVAPPLLYYLAKRR